MVRSNSETDLMQLDSKIHDKSATINRRDGVVVTVKNISIKQSYVVYYNSYMKRDSIALNNIKSIYVHDVLTGLIGSYATAAATALVSIPFAASMSDQDNSEIPNVNKIYKIMFGVAIVGGIFGYLFFSTRTYNFDDY